MMAKNINKINHNAIKLRITGRLELEQASVKRCTSQELCVHCRLEQFVQAVRPLNELEGDCHDKQFLQRGEDALLRPKPDYNCGDQATQAHDGIKDIPTIRTETVPSQPVTSDGGIQDDYARDHQEKVVYSSSGGRLQI